MNILMTTDAVGGVWTYSQTLCQALHYHGVNVWLAILGNVSDDQLAQASSLSNVTVATRQGKLEWMEDPWDDVAAMGDWLLELAETSCPDVVHLNDYAHGSLPWNAPVLMVGHSCVLSWFEAVRGEPAGPSWKHYREVVREGLQAADLVVAPTAHMLAALNRFYGPLPRRRVIMNGCDVATFGARSKQPFVFAAGRFWDEAKNLRTLSAAAEEIQWPVYVAGIAHPDGHEGQFEGVHWLGTLAPRAMADSFAHASIYAHPALYEPFGLTVLEAALSRCALVLGDIPTLREIWGDAACYVAPRDARQLASAVNYLIHDAEFREDLAERALRRGRELTAERMGQSYMAAYHHCMATESKAAPTGEKH